MGGCSYDRDVYGSSSSWGGVYSSSVAASIMSSSSLDSTMRSVNKIIKSKSKHPIVIMLDVTGSNTEFAKIVYDKMPMFYGQIEQKGYLKDFDISICAVGDAYTDNYPLQIADFSKGLEIDNWLKKLVLEGCGGGQRCETYELAAYYLLKNLKYNADSSPIILFLGDEAPYDTVISRLIREYVDSGYGDDGDFTTKEVFKELLEKIPNTYVFLNPYQGVIREENIIKTWKDLFPDNMKEHVITMQENNEKAIVDLMLGVISMIGNKDLENYKIDMLDRGQTNERIASVDKMLKGLSNSLVPMTTVSGLQKSTRNQGRENKNKRL